MHTGESFKKRVVAIIRRIPEGKVTTYGRIAAFAGVPRGSRGVAWILHACSDRDSLPWHRVVNRNGRISLPVQAGYELQKMLLESEGVRFSENERIDLDLYGWSPSDGDMGPLWETLGE